MYFKKRMKFFQLNRRLKTNFQHNRYGKFFSYLVVLCFSAAGYAQQVTLTYSTPNTYSVPIPCAASSVTGYAWGGGGGGGGVEGTWAASRASGGGGGGYIMKNDFSAGGNTMSIIVGAGGTRGNNNSSGGNGGTGGSSEITYMGYTIYANGGSGGTFASGTTPSTYGAGGTTSANGTVFQNGERGRIGGEQGNIFSNTSGDGGRSYPSNGMYQGGTGGSGVQSTDGNPGNPPGGGGSGGHRAVLSTSNSYGGAGAAGRVIVSFDLSANPVSIDVNPTFCQGEMITLSVGASPCPLATYTWYHHGTQIGIGAMLNIANATSAQNGIYTVKMDISHTYTGASVSVANMPNGYAFTGNTLNGSFISQGILLSMEQESVISNKTDTICSGQTFTISPYDDGTDIVIAGTTYSWAEPIASGITGKAAGNEAATISGTLVNTTNIAQNITYTVTPKRRGVCYGNPFLVTVTVKPAVVPTIIISASRD
jgi:hypothetical protein